jgi:hypothetical protein
MKSFRKLNRRSFLASVVGGTAAGSLLIVSDDAAALQSSCSDADPLSRGGDPGGRGRNCQGRASTGCSDRDPTDPGGGGRNCTTAARGCSDSDPSDPVSQGRRCGGNTTPNNNEGAYATGRRERRYQVCWVDHPSRSNAECNMQTYSEWAITYSDGRVEYDLDESRRRQAEMTARGYTARYHQMIVNEW